MQSLSEDEKRQVLGSVLTDQLSAIQELVKNVPEINSSVERLESAIDQMGSDMKIIRAAIADLSDQVNDHERQIAKLQTV